MIKRLRTRSSEMYCAMTALVFMLIGLITAVLLLHPMFRRTVEANLLQILIETPCVCIGLLVGIYPVALIVYVMIRNIVQGAPEGAFHICNVFTGHSMMSTLQAIIDSFAIGILITAIYFRAGNLWVVAFIHGCLDFATLFNSSVYTYTIVSGAAASTTAAKMSFLSIILSLALQLLLDAVLYIAPAYFLLRDSKIEQVEQHFGEDCRSFAAGRAAQQE